MAAEVQMPVPVAGDDFGDEPAVVVQEHGPDLAREGLSGLPRDMAGGLNDLFGPVLDEVTDRVNDLQFVGEQLCRRDLLHLGDEVRGRGDKNGV